MAVWYVLQKLGNNKLYYYIIFFHLILINYNMYMVKTL